MSETLAEPLEREPRYSVCDRRAIQVHIERAEGRRPTGAPAELLDLSLTGARIAVPIPLEPDEALRLWLGHDDSGLDEMIIARLRWVRPGKGRTWLAGCLFLAGLSAETIDKLSALGCLDQETFERSPLAGEATVWQQLQPSGVTVQLVDLSRGGLSLVTSQATPVGQRLRLVPHSPEGPAADILVQVRCCAALANGFLLSCQFEQLADYRILRGTVGANQRVRRGHLLLKHLRHQTRRISRTIILLLGGVFVGLAVGVTQPRFGILGLLSVLAYVGLELADEQRKRLRESKWSELFEDLLGQRLEEHQGTLQSGWTARPIGPAHGTPAEVAGANAAE